MSRLCGEIACWLALPAAFLALYVGHFGAPAGAIAPHLRILADALAGLACVRIAFACCGASGRARRAADTVLVGGAAACLIGYYALVLTGLQSWGRVITSQLALIYLPQFGALLDVLSLSAWVVAGAVGSVLAAGLAIGRLAATRLDWIGPLLARAPRRALEYGAVILALGACGDFAWYTLSPPVAAQEPIALSFFPWDAALPVEHNGMDRAAAERREARDHEARRQYVKAPAPARHNLVFIVIDSLRADHTSLYGYARDTTPYLSSLAASPAARLSVPARTSCAETLCGVLSLVTSRYVHQFSSHMFTLHEVLGRYGYRRVVITSDDQTNFYGLREHYGEVEEYHDAVKAYSNHMYDDRAVLDRVRGLPDWDGASPVMLHLHLMSAHMLGYLDADNLAWRPAVSYFSPANRVDAAGRPLAAAVNFYDDGVHQADDIVRGILEALERKGYLRDSLVVITGDHGESLGEKGKWGHGNSVYEEVLRVPLLLVSHGYSPRPLRARHPAQVDIAPTILAELGIPAPSTWQGSPLQDPEQSRFVYFQQAGLMGLVDRANGGWKYWEDPISHRDFVSRLVGTRAGKPTTDFPAQLLTEWRKAIVPLAAETIIEASRSVR